jgi:hypothetical protein
MKTRALCLLSFAAMTLAAIGSVAGCSSGGAGHPTTSSENRGTVELALSARGSDGATYSLPYGTYLQLISATGNNNVNFFLDPTTPTQAISMPADDYQVSLLGGTDAGAFALVRQADGGPSTVTGQLLDPQPMAITITADQATPLVFHFAVAEAGNVTFSNGTLVVSTQVDASAGPPTTMLIAGPLTFQTTDQGSSSAVNALFTPWDSPTISTSIRISLFRNWSAEAGTACASGTATITATPLVDSPTDNDVAAFLEEVSGSVGQASFCLADAASGGGMTVLIERRGPPQTAAFQTALGADPATFYLNLTFTTPTPLYDDKTAYLSQLSQPLAVPTSMFGCVAAGTAGGPCLADFNTMQGSTLTVQLAP